MANFYAQKWQFWNSPRISETAAPRVEISSILTPWGGKGVLCGTLAYGQVGSEAECQGPWASCFFVASYLFNILFHFDRQVLHMYSCMLTYGWPKEAKIFNRAIAPMLKYGESFFRYGVYICNNTFNSTGVWKSYNQRHYFSTWELTRSWTKLEASCVPSRLLNHCPNKDFQFQLYAYWQLMGHSMHGWVYKVSIPPCE